MDRILNLARLTFLTFYFLSVSNTLSAQWIQRGQDIDGEAANDRSGFAIDMPNSRTIAIGAFSNDGGGNDAGHLRVYTWNGTSWNRKGVDIDGDSIGDEFGYAVSMPDTNTIAVGARKSDRRGLDAGEVKVYRWNGSNWIQKGSSLLGENANDEFGFSVAMSDSNHLVVGAWRNDGNGSNSGSIRSFSWNGSNWIQRGADIDGEAAGDQLGTSVSMPDSNVISSGAFSNNGKGNQAGHVRVYEWNGIAWLQKGLDIDGDTINDQSGISISMPDKNHIGIGSFAGSNNGSFSGHTNIYRWNGNSWVKKGNPINGEASGDQSGTQVVMPDSNTIGIGAPANSANGFAAGQARVFVWDGNNWVQRGLDVDGENATDQAGRGLAMPNDSVVAVGAPDNSDRAQYAGHARVFKFQLGTHISEFQNKSNQSKISVYPNPAIENFFFKTCDEGEMLIICDMHGRVVYEGMINSEIKKIDVSNWTVGIYSLRYGKDILKLVVSR